MSAQNYKVTFGYNAKYPWGGRHRGNDRACPVGTEVRIEGVLIARTGNTGLTTGPHLHTQAGTDIACQKDINPTPLEFKAGKVVRTGAGPTWGKFVTIQVGSQFITYCHLSQIIAPVGLTIYAPKPPQPQRPMPPVGSKVRLTINRTAFKPGTTQVAGTIRPAGGYNYIVRGYDPKFPGRIIVNSASAGGTVALALYYVNGAKIEGWSQV